MTTIMRRMTACRNQSAKRFSLLLISASLLAIFFGFSSSSAFAYDCENGREITFKLKNDNGVPQYSVDVWVLFDSWQLVSKMNNLDSPFQETVSCFENGDRVRVTRYWDKTDSSNPDNAPEGNGVEYTITSTTPGEVTLVVPRIGNGSSTELSKKEKTFLGLLNKKRNANGRDSLYISNSLREYHSSALNLLKSKPNSRIPFNLSWDTGLLPEDGANYPFFSVYYSLSEGYNWSNWKVWIRKFIDENSTFSEFTNLPNTAAVDIAQRGNTFYLLVFNKCLTPENVQACRITSEKGNLDVFENNPGTNPGTNPGSKKNPAFKVQTSRVRTPNGKKAKRRLKAIAFVKKAAKGNSFVRLRVSGKAKRIKAKRFGKKLVYILKIRKNTKVSRVSTFCFKGKNGWKTTCVKKPTRIAFQ